MSSIEGRRFEGKREQEPGRGEYQPVDSVTLLPDSVYEEICDRFHGTEIPHPDVKRVLVFPDRERASQAAAQQKIEVARRNRYGFFLNPTGDTFVPIHRLVAKAQREGLINFSDTWHSHLDSYWPYIRNGKYSFPLYIRDEVIDPLHIREGHYRLIDEEADNPMEEAARHDTWISRMSQTMAQYGVGPDGHLAFILPGTPFDVGVHWCNLSKETLYRDHIERKQDTPDTAITIGPRNIIEGGIGHIQVVLFGAQKGEKLNEALTGPITPDHTASLLRLPQVRDAVTIFCDEEVAGQFNW